MNPFDLPNQIQDQKTYASAVKHLRGIGVRLPLFRELANAPEALSEITSEISTVDADAPDPRNLFRVHWFNDSTRHGLSNTPCLLYTSPSPRDRGCSRMRASA